jgi:putative glycosyltransferase (TIGR04372 family)
MVHGRPVISFTRDDEAVGRDLLMRIGVPPNAPYACFGVREDKYYEEAWAKRAAKVFPWTSALASNDFPLPPDEGSRQQFSTMQSVMSVDIANYAHVLRRCAESGIYMLRIGLNVDRPLPPDLGGKVIDYARYHRTEFGDLYLTTHCKFILTGATGFYTLGMALKRPIVVTDYYLPSLGFPSTATGVDNIVLPRLFWYVSEKRLLTFSEMLQCDRLYQRAANCIDDQIEVLHSAPEDIADAVTELNQRIDGTWVGTDEDDYLHKKFLALYEPYQEGRGMNSRISARFLTKHRVLIR